MVLMQVPGGGQIPGSAHSLMSEKLQNFTVVPFSYNFTEHTQTLVSDLLVAFLAGALVAAGGVDALVLANVASGGAFV
jgi:hypothetical protein